MDVLVAGGGSRCESSKTRKQQSKPGAVQCGVCLLPTGSCAFQNEPGAGRQAHSVTPFAWRPPFRICWKTSAARLCVQQCSVKCSTSQAESPSYHIGECYKHPLFHDSSPIASIVTHPPAAWYIRWVNEACRVHCCAEPGQYHALHLTVDDVVIGLRSGASPSSIEICVSSTLHNTRASLISKFCW